MKQHASSARPAFLPRSRGGERAPSTWREGALLNSTALASVRSETGKESSKLSSLLDNVLVAAMSPIFIFLVFRHLKNHMHGEATHIKGRQQKEVQQRRLVIRLTTTTVFAVRIVTQGSFVVLNEIGTA